MEKNAARGRDARIAVRVSGEDLSEIGEAARTRGYRSTSAFVRTAIRNELHGREELSGIEERIIGSFERLSNETFRIGRALQALFALLEALSKTVLTCVPEPSADSKPQAIALARDRYHRLIRAAGVAMAGEARATMEDLLNHDPER